MTASFTNTFGGTVVYPSDVSYRAFTMAADTSLTWPTEIATDTNVVAKIMDVTASIAGLSLYMPDASNASVGETSLIFNVGTESFTVVDSGGNVITVIAPGESWQLYLIDNTTPNGAWRSIEYGAGVSSSNAGALAGKGIKAITTTLNQSMPVVTYPIVPGSYTYTMNSALRAQTVVWDSSSTGTLILPLAANNGADWFFNLRNNGAGSVSVVTTGGETIDGLSSIAFGPGDTATIICDGTNYISIGRGNTSTTGILAFDYVSLDLTGIPSPYILTGTNLNRIAYNFTGTLTANMQIIVPLSLQQYWVANNTTGSFTLTVKTLSGYGVQVTQGYSQIVYCDGSNVVPANNFPNITDIPVSAGGIYVDNFSGNGATQVFSLTYSIANEDRTQVYINGVYQQKDTYTVAGTTLTFSSPPPSGTNNIEVVSLGSAYYSALDVSFTPYANITSTNVQDAIEEEINDLAAGTGSSLVGYNQGGVGAVTRTSRSKLQETVSIKDFGAVGDGVTDDTVAIQAALNASTSVYVPIGNYVISAALTVPANTLFYGDGTIEAEAGYTPRFMVLAGAGSTIRNLAFDGTNMPVPTGAWTGAGVGTARAPIGSAIFINGASGSEIAGVTLDNLSFANFPSGPVCAFYADGLRIEGCKANTVQTYVGAETNAVFTVYHAAAPAISNCAIDGFNWKGFYFAYTTQGSMVNCSAIGGVAGHAAHYVVNGSGNTLSACSQTGGFGFKCTNAEDVIVDAYVSLNSSNSGLYAYCSKNVVFSNCVVKQPAARGILITADSSFGPCLNILITGCEVIYKTAAAGINETALYISGDATHGVEDVTISNCKFWQPFFGVQVAASASSLISKLNILGCTFYRPVQYGILAYVKSTVISNCNFDLNTALPAGYLLAQSSVAGDELVVAGNRSITSSGSGVHWDVATGAGAGSCVFDSILFANNVANGGNQFIKIAGNNAATDAVNNITLTGNVGVDQAAANAIVITANGTTTTNCTTLTGNVLSSGATRRNIRVENSANVTNKVDSGNNVNAVTYA